MRISGNKICRHPHGFPLYLGDNLLKPFDLNTLRKLVLAKVPPTLMKGQKEIKSLLLKTKPEARAIAARI